MRDWLKLKWSQFRLWWVNPAPTPEEIESGTAPKYTRPVPLELGFLIHPDGRVYQRDRMGRGDRRVEDKEVIELVYREYRIVADQARKHFRKEKLLTRDRGSTHVQ